MRIAIVHVKLSTISRTKFRKSWPLRPRSRKNAETVFPNVFSLRQWPVVDKYVTWELIKLPAQFFAAFGCAHWQSVYVSQRQGGHCEVESEWYSRPYAKSSPPSSSPYSQTTATDSGPTETPIRQYSKRKNTASKGYTVSVGLGKRWLIQRYPDQILLCDIFLRFASRNRTLGIFPTLMPLIMPISRLFFVHFLRLGTVLLKTYC